MIICSEKFFSKKFSGETTKEAYMKAAKWVAKYVVAKDGLEQVTYNYEKLKEEAAPTIQLTLYVSMNENEIQDRHCAICKESHSHFFISEETNCNWCKLLAYHKRKKDSIKVKKSYCGEMLRKNIEASDYDKVD